LTFYWLEPAQVAAQVKTLMRIKIKTENASNTMPNLLSKWIRKIVSDVHGVIVGLIVMASLPLLYFYGNQMLNQTTRALNRPMPLWVTVSTVLGTLLICIFFLKRALASPKTENMNNKIDETTKQEVISGTHIKILELLFEKPSTVENLCKALELSREEVKYYLTDLCDNKVMIDPPSAYSSGPEEWRIDQMGREYVMSHRDSEKIARAAWNAHT
jgi:hypothetical protein